MASSHASAAGEVYTPAAMPSNEKYKIPDLESLRVLLCQSEGIVSPETKEMLERASREIVEHLQAPLRSGINTVTNHSQELDASVLHEHEKEVESGTEALNFLASFCDSLRGPGGCENVLVDVGPVIEKGIKVRGAVEISIVGKEPNDILGRVGGREVGRVSVIIKRGSDDDAQGLYTRQQINFRLSDQTFRYASRKSEIRSLRVDLSTGNPNLVEVDAQIGTSEEKAVSRTYIKHQRVSALSGPNASEKFGVLQDVFLLNFVRNAIGNGKEIDYSKGQVLVGAGVSFVGVKDREREKDLVKTCKSARNRLGVAANGSNGGDGQRVPGSYEGLSETEG